MSESQFFCYLCGLLLVMIGWLLSKEKISGFLNVRYFKNLPFSFFTWYVATYHHQLAYHSLLLISILLSVSKNTEWISKEKTSCDFLKSTSWFLLLSWSPDWVTFCGNVLSLLFFHEIIEIDFHFWLIR